MNQLNLALPDFKGETYDERRDGARLKGQLDRVRAAMRDGHWLTLSALSVLAHAPEASASARLRDLRREGLTIERRYVDRGLFEYRMVP